jgi:hypothetical protein
MDATSKDGSKADLAKETWVEKLVKAIATVGGEHIQQN